jgi:hypothetical protein
MKGTDEKVEVIISDSDDPHQAGMWSDDCHDEDDNTDITYKSLSEVKWVPRLEADLEEILIEKHFDFGKAASEF